MNSVDNLAFAKISPADFERVINRRRKEMNTETTENEWFSTDEALPRFGMTVVGDDHTIAWLDKTAGWLKEWPTSLGICMQPRERPSRWRLLREDEQLAAFDAHNPPPSVNAKPRQFDA
jgi:hypothetical protein